MTKQTVHFFYTNRYKRAYAYITSSLKTSASTYGGINAHVLKSVIHEII